MQYRPIEGVRVIGLGHKARHGKDTAAKTLSHYLDGVERFGFADDMYAICRVLYGMVGKDAPLLQVVGTEAFKLGKTVTLPDGRVVAPPPGYVPDAEVWTRAVYSKILAARPRVAVITDVRFPNEMEFVKALGGECWKVERRLKDGSLYVDPSRPATHISETALDAATWDRVIVNPDGEQDEFQQLILSAFYESQTKAA